ncbi:uncharacterized protein LOC116212044 [Punica granatum]|uniref:C2H2-type domain-containing protein n=2 Tax=Punica granatum TaxID=22663 RepID=A0A218W968_PUNGR|nr:uncharacterized protein LOC116212044 [Punica granatum]OWM68751.1 hypothetical protein CDL15_Pgr024938 [Punica granatum]PKI66452.1 hypothetical protein CRG98_013108 [Punica granatum]
MVRTVRVGSFFNKFFSLFLLLLLGCFSSSSAASADGHREPPRPNKKKRKLLAAASSSASAVAAISSRFKATKALSSSWASIKRAFTRMPSRIAAAAQTQPSPGPTTPTLTSARSSHRSLVSMVQPETLNLLEPHSLVLPSQESNVSSDDNPLFLPLRNDIFPCTACAEIFPKPHLLEQHQSMKHAVSELTGEDSGQNIVKIIFKMGWTNKDRSPKIDRILKIHNSPKILTRFEEYRELVKSKAARNGAAGRRRDERCIADGNELLRFHCSTFMCELGQDGNSATCNQQYCSVCGIIRSGFSPKLDGISTLSTSWRAHMAIPDETLEEFRFMNVKRAMLICRVIAGRVGCDPVDEDGAEKGGCGFDSVVGRGGSGALTLLDEEELLVFNPRAVLPCFVIVFTV